MQNIKFLFKTILFISFINTTLFASFEKFNVGVLYKEIFTTRNEAKIVSNTWENQFRNEKTSFKIKPILYEDEKKILNDYLNKKISSIIAGVEFFYKNRKILEENSKYKWIISRSNNKFEEFYFLKNSKKRLSIKDIKEDSTIYYKEDIARVWGEYILRKETKNRKFNFKRLNKSRKLIYDTFFKENILSVVGKDLYDSSIELNPQIKENVEIIKKSEEIFFRAVGFTIKGLDQRIYDELLEVLLETNEKNKNIKTLSFLNLAKIFVLKDNEIEELDDFFEEYFKLKGVNQLEKRVLNSKQD